MNGIPVNEMLLTSDRDKIVGLGTEVNAAHDLLCSIRHAGGTIKDVHLLSNLSRSELGRLIARARGLNVDSSMSTFLNLDCSPYMEDGLSNIKLITDIRLGMHMMYVRNEEYIIADKKIVAVPVCGHCIVSGEYIRETLGRTDQYEGFEARFLDLNAQAAVSMAEKTFHIAGRAHQFPTSFFPGAESEYQMKVIFFLGTVWMRRLDCGQSNIGANRGWEICAKAIRFNKNGSYQPYDAPLPAGEWPNDHRIAILVRHGHDSR